MTATTLVPDPDDDYPDPSADGFHPYWLGRTSEALRYLLANPESDTARQVAAETLAAYSERTGQGVR